MKHWKCSSCETINNGEVCSVCMSRMPEFEEKGKRPFRASQLKKSVPGRVKSEPMGMRPEPEIKHKESFHKRVSSHVQASIQEITMQDHPMGFLMIGLAMLSFTIQSIAMFAWLLQRASASGSGNESMLHEVGMIAPIIGTALFLLGALMIIKTTIHRKTFTVISSIMAAGVLATILRYMHFSLHIFGDAAEHPILNFILFDLLTLPEFPVVLCSAIVLLIPFKRRTETYRAIATITIIFFAIYLILSIVEGDSIIINRQVFWFIRFIPFIMAGFLMAYASKSKKEMKSTITESYEAKAWRCPTCSTVIRGGFCTVCRTNEL